MALQWQWKEQIGQLDIMQGDKKFTLSLYTGNAMLIILHENDHLDGFLYIDRGDEEFRQQTIDTFKRREERRAEKEKLKAQKAAKLQAKLAKKG